MIDPNVSDVTNYQSYEACLVYEGDDDLDKASNWSIRNFYGTYSLDSDSNWASLISADQIDVPSGQIGTWHIDYNMCAAEKLGDNEFKITHWA